MKVSRSMPLRYILILAGIASVALGIVGIFLPLLPTTPFMLLAAACFARSSPRFHNALLNSHMFGPIITQWEQQRSIPKRAKKQAIFLIIIVFSISIALIQDNIVRALLVGMAGLLIGFLLRIPSSEPGAAQQS